jgi:hypothetical protein
MRLPYLITGICVFFWGCTSAPVEREVDLSQVGQFVIGNIVKGNTTAHEILKMFGRPCQQFSAVGYVPERWVYCFYGTQPGSSASLVILFDNRHVVWNFAYNESPMVQPTPVANDYNSPPSDSTVPADDQSSAQVVGNPPPTPTAPRETDQEKLERRLRIAGKLSVAVVAGALSQPKEGEGKFFSLLKRGANKWADQEIASAIAEVINALSPDLQRELISVVSSFLRDSSGFSGITEDEVKQQIVDWVKQVSEVAAAVGPFIDVLYDLYVLLW